MKRIDTLFVGGDHAVDSRGLPVSIAGARELIQRALFRLTIKKGSFDQDPSLGSELYKLRGLYGENTSRMAQSYVQEALISMPEVTVSGVRLERKSPDILRLFVILEIAANQYQLEVDVN